MRRIVLGLFVLVAVLGLTATAGQAQTCPPDPVTGFAVAQMISPTNGSTLPAGAVTFTWCNASADYFVQIESVPGAHDIFYAFTGGAGKGAGQNFVTLGPLCTVSAPIECIPANGETIYVTLWTVKNKQILPPSPFQYTYKAASSGAPPAATTTSVTSASVFESTADQSVTLTATVGGGTVNEGTVTFQVKNGATNVGTAVTSATLTTGSASVVYVLPGGTLANTYTINAAYSGGTNFLASSGTGTLTVNLPPPVQAPTSTAVDPQSTTFSSAAQSVTLTATVADGGSTVNEGTVTFQVKDGATNVGTAVTSATLTSGSASAIYDLPAGLAAKTYTIRADYSGGTNFLISNGSANLTVSQPPPVGQVATSTTASNTAAAFSSTVQNVTLTAAVSVPGQTVNEGTVTFQVWDGAVSVGSAVPSATLTNDVASVSYALPAGLATKDYTIQADYSGGPDFLASTGFGTLTIGQLTALSPARVWIGLKNSDDIGIKFDLQVIVRKNGSQIGAGQSSSVIGGSSGFNNAKLDTIPLTLTSGPMGVSTGDILSIELLVRNACRGSGKNSGTARLWLNGAKSDSGPARDAGSRFDATIGTATTDYFLRTSSALSTTAGSARTSRDLAAGPKCSSFKSFGTWSVTLP